MELRSNEVKNGTFSINKTKQDHSYKVYWTYRLQLLDKKKRPIAAQTVLIKNQKNEIVAELKSDEKGWIQTELLSEEKKKAADLSDISYIVETAGQKRIIKLVKNTNDKMTIITHE